MKIPSYRFKINSSNAKYEVLLAETRINLSSFGIKLEVLMHHFASPVKKMIQGVPLRGVCN